MNDQALLRYSRHILLPQIDVAGQQKICDAHVLIIGLGGLGSPVAMYLAASGIGRFTLVDDDVVDSSNLQRQIIHNEESIDKNKAESAQAAMRSLNPNIEFDVFSDRLDDKNLLIEVGRVDAVVDCTDNFATRKKINAACVKLKKPLVSGAAIRMEGQLSVFDQRQTSSPCYECLYSIDDDENLTCAESGVLAPLVGVIGCAQALEVLKIITGVGETLCGTLGLFDAASGRWQYLNLNKDPQCSVCS